MRKAEKKLRFVKEILPVLPSHITWKDGQRYKLIISSGRAVFKCRKDILVEFTARNNHDVGLKIMQWLDANAEFIIG